MKRYQINETEFMYLQEMIAYLNQEENTMSEEGAKQMKDVLGRIASRPVLDIIIDKSVLEAADDEDTEN